MQYIRKIRITYKMKETDLSILLKKRTELKQSIKKDPNNDNLKQELDDIEANITNQVSDENRDKLFENFKNLDQSEGENFSHGI